MRLTRKDKVDNEIRHKYMIDRSSEIEKNWDDKDLVKQVLKIKEYNITRITFQIDLGDMLGTSTRNINSKNELLQLLDQTPTEEKIIAVYLDGEYKGIEMTVIVASGLIVVSENSQYNKEIAALVEKM